MAAVFLELQIKQKMTQLQRLTIQLIGLHQQELQGFLQEQVESNPLLDIRYPDVRREPVSGSGEKAIDRLQGREDSLEELLLGQLRLYTGSKRTVLAAGVVIRNLDERGFFCADKTEAASSYGLSRQEMEAGLALVQTFDPPGIGATSLQEALILQARRCSTVPAGTVEMLQGYYDDFLKGRWARLQQELALTAEDMQNICNFIKTLALRPASQISQEERYVRPDLEIYLDEEGQPAVRFLEELPEVFFRDDLYASYVQTGDGKVRTYVNKARRAFWDLQSALSYRRDSIRQVAEELGKAQTAFFVTGAVLQPFTQKELARRSGLSESTVSRVCRERYLLFDHTVYAVRDFFSRSYMQHQGAEGNSVYISKKAVQEKLCSLIRQENPDRPYSDQEMADLLQQEGVTIARRTVTKLRHELGISRRSVRCRLKNNY